MLYYSVLCCYHGQDASSSSSRDAYAVAGRSFWKCVVDERAFMQGAKSRLVWCDVAQGEYSLLESRPLVPHLLLHAAWREGTSYCNNSYCNNSYCNDIYCNNSYCKQQLS